VPQPRDPATPISGIACAAAERHRQAEPSEVKSHMIKVERRSRHVQAATVVLARSVKPVALAVGVPVAILTQARLSVFAAAGEGVATVRAPAWPVVLSVLSAALAALGLLWPAWHLPRVRVHVPHIRLWLSRVVSLRVHVHLPRPLSVPALADALSDWLWLHVMPSRRWSARERGKMLALCGALAASLIADMETWSEALLPQAAGWWIGSVALLLLSALLVSPAAPTLRARSRSWSLLRDAVLLALLTALSLALRLPNLTAMPYVVHGDEAANGLQALRWLHGDVRSLLETGWYGLPVAGYGLPALVMHVAGADLYGLRLSSVLIGTLGVLLTYALARVLALVRSVAFLGAGLLAVSHVAIHFSRVGIHYIHAMTVVVLALWLLVYALRYRSAPAAVLTAVSMSLALQVYFSARVVLVVVPAFLIALCLVNRAAPRDRLRIIGWLALGLVVTIGPLAQFFLLNPAPFIDRTNEVLLLHQTPDLRAYLLSQFGTADLTQVLLRQVATVPLLAGGLADQSSQYGPHVGMLDPLVAGLATIGFFLVLFRMRQPASLLLVLWTLATVAAGVLSIDAPWWPRLLVMLPALCILAAGAAGACWRTVRHVVCAIMRPRLSKRRAPVRRARPRSRLLGRLRRPQIVTIASSTLLIVAVLGYSGLQSSIHYFHDYARLVNTDAYRTRFTDLGYFVASLPAGRYVILFTQDDMDLSYDTVAFLAPHVQGETVHTPDALKQSIWKHPTNTTIIILPSAQDMFEELLASGRQSLPSGTYAIQPSRPGHLVIATYTT
jgi:Dolichyl-phosphate-mannose-protein mannosyltransferase